MNQSEAVRADYGVDAPGVVCNLFLAATAGLLAWGSAAFGLWSGGVTIPGIDLRLVLGASGLWVALGCAFTGTWMLWNSKVGKLRDRERWLDQIPWHGDEQVLDVGCGRGLLLIGAAKRLTTGRATGIDLWQAEDLSGNQMDATKANAQREGVAERVEVETADMRELPFAPATFDVIVSRAAIHNLYVAEDRARAIREITRVLKPGGQALIDDIRHAHEYTATFEAQDCQVQRLDSKPVSLFWTLLTWGGLRPVTLLARKAG